MYGRCTFHFQYQTYRVLWTLSKEHISPTAVRFVPLVPPPTPLAFCPDSGLPSFNKLPDADYTPDAAGTSGPVRHLSVVLDWDGVGPWGGVGGIIYSRHPAHASAGPARPTLSVSVIGYSPNSGRV